MGVGRWNSPQLPDKQISILQRAEKLLKCWDRETGGNTKKFLTPCRAESMNTKRGRRKMVGVNLQLSCPCPERQVWCGSPRLQGNCSGPCVGLCSRRHFPPPPFSFLSLRVITYGCKRLLLGKRRRPAPSIGFPGCCVHEPAFQGIRAACFWRLSKTLKWDVFCISFKFRDVLYVWICICVCMRVHVCVHMPTHVL